jgi:hypothetical protein
MRKMKVLVASAILGSASLVSAAPVFSETFNSSASSAKFNVTSIAGSADTITFGYDYSANLIAEAPNTPSGATATRGLFVQANKPAGTAGAINGINITPAVAGSSIAFTGDTVMTFDMWLNVPTPLTNTTEQALFGINTDGLGVNSRTGATQTGADGVWFHAANEGGYGNTATAANSRDYVAYINNTVPAGQRFDNGDAPFPTLFPNGPLVGAVGNGWVQVEVADIANQITVKFNGTTVFSFLNTGPTDGSVFLGYQDPFSGSIGARELFAIYDNLRVVPEPATLGVHAGGALLALRRRN